MELQTHLPWQALDTCW